MSQRDCGCPGLVTPTLDELLAVARQKPLPRVRVRERRAPPARVGATLKGWLEWRLINRQGREVRGGEGPNLILDQGLDEIAATPIFTDLTSGGTPSTFFQIIRYAAVGTDSSTPDPSDTGLGAELARVDTKFSTDELTRPTNGVYRLTRHIEFGYETANGVLTEWGFSSNASTGSNLFNRALFTDSGGSPDAITKTSDEKLRLTYTLEVSLSPVSWTAGSFTITGVGAVNGDYTLLGGTLQAVDALCKAPDLTLFSALARGAIGTAASAHINQVPETAAAIAHPTDLSGVTYASHVANISDITERRAPREVGEPRDAYTAGTFTRTGGTWKWDTAYGNLDPIKGFYIQGSAGWLSIGGTCGIAGYAFDLDEGDEFSKDDEHALTIGVPTVTWGRDSS